MAHNITGSLTVKDHTIAIVVSRFNSTVTQALASGAEDTFLRHGGNEDDLSIIWVPGAFEIPAIVKRLTDSEKYDGVLALGALIKGATPHFDILAQQVTRSLAWLATQSSTPISFGVLTTATLEQALERAGNKAGNKGAEAMLGLIEMINLTIQLN
ncbi:MAG: 6,7-dimethyl-8-ribityllumazine synthase [Candidatus Marinimicrobia bacterium]|nr:6,7-dimethyl-8-ribityllumazine synthase [Candidatus Neomarinimicrobiota bacterium]